MIPILTLALIGILEAVAFVWRYRASLAHRFAGTFASTLAVCILRVLFVAAGVSAVLKETPIIVAVLAYAIPAAVVSGYLDHIRSKK
jgi:uncharacterized membrane protein SpoIIM required for sporulation